MQVLFVLWFSNSDKTDKIDRLIYTSGSYMAVNISSVVKQLMYALKWFGVTAGSIHSFGIRSKETLRVMYLIMWSKESTSVMDLFSVIGCSNVFATAKPIWNFEKVVVLVWVKGDWEERFEETVNFRLPSSPSDFFLLPPPPPQGLLFSLSPIFLPHKIKGGSHSLHGRVGREENTVSQTGAS